jgi:hypothetical protein
VENHFNSNKEITLSGSNQFPCMHQLLTKTPVIHESFVCSMPSITVDSTANKNGHEKKVEKIKLEDRNKIKL